MEDLGWIKAHRKLQQNFLYTENRVFSKFEAWFDILMNVNFTDKDMLWGNVVLTCKRGECLYSLDTWAKRWNWTKSKVNRFLILLQSREMIVKTNVKKTIRITVCNYDSYQSERNASETQVKRERNASETQVKPTKEVKKEIKEEGKNKQTLEQKINELKLPFSEKFGNTWLDWIQYKKDIKNPFRTIQTVNKQIKFLSQFDESTAIEIIEQSIMNGWKGLFDLQTVKRITINEAEQFYNNQVLILNGQKESDAGKKYIQFIDYLFGKMQTKDTTLSVKKNLLTIPNQLKFEDFLKIITMCREKNVKILNTFQKMNNSTTLDKNTDLFSTASNWISMSK